MVVWTPLILLPNPETTAVRAGMAEVAEVAAVVPGSAWVAPTNSAMTAELGHQVEVAGTRIVFRQLGQGWEPAIR